MGLLLGAATLIGSLDGKLVVDGEEGFGGGAIDMELRFDAEEGG